LEIVDTLYYDIMDLRGDGFSQDCFIMSKGHGYLAQLSVLESLGILDPVHLDWYCTPDGLLGAHPDRGIPGIEAATGSLGHGLGIGLGIAIAVRNVHKIRGSLKCPSVYVLLSDGELQEGSTWEAILMASSLQVQNLTAIVDNNDYQSLGRTSETHPTLYPLEEKFEAFGWKVTSIDGHSREQLTESCRAQANIHPRAIIAKTVKGKGVSFMEDVALWHYRSPTAEEYAKAVRELEAKK
jgi:transketolase